jgi:hypothetical protein
MTDAVAEVVRKKRVQLATPITEAQLKNMAAIKKLHE